MAGPRPASGGARGTLDSGPSAAALRLRVTFANISHEGSARSAAGAGVPVVFAPGVVFVHPAGVTAWFTPARAASSGLEHLAEDGDVTTMFHELSTRTDGSADVFGTDTGTISYDDAPIRPGETADVVIQARVGDRLDFGMMWAQSNDVFVAPRPDGAPLFDAEGQLRDRLSEVFLWDAGTEVNQEPGAGDAQAPRQAAPNTGAAEHSVIQALDANNEDSSGYAYPGLEGTLEVTVARY